MPADADIGPESRQYSTAGDTVHRYFVYDLGGIWYHAYVASTTKVPILACYGKINGKHLYSIFSFEYLAIYIFLTLNLSKL